MISIAILDDYQNAAKTYADWSVLDDRASITVFTDTLLDEQALVDRLKPFTVISTMRERTKFDEALLSKLPNLRLLTTTAMRNRGIDVKAALDRGIIVSGTSATSSSTIEHIWALLLATVRYVALEHSRVRASESQWQDSVPMGLSGKVLGVIGLGRLGQATAKIAKAFNLRVLAWSPHLTRERAEEAGVNFAESKEELLRRADIVTIHMVLSKETRHLLTLQDLLLMKSSAFLINTSRGPLVEEEGLIQVLHERRIAGAGLDVFDIEPLPLNHPLRQSPNVTLTPHFGYVSDDAYKVWWPETVENIIAFLNGNPLRVIQL